MYAGDGCARVVEYQVIIATMFDKLKDAYHMREQAKEMQAVLSKEQVTGSSRDGTFHITINGSFDVQDVLVREGAELSKTLVEKGIKEAFIDASQKLKGVLMQKFKGMM